MKKYLVIGNPIEHSLSPQLHNYWFKQNNIDAVYEKKQIKESDIEAIISEKKIFEESNFPLILVQDTFVALSKISEYNFKDIKSLKIAITGSVGKTTTKDYLKNVLSYYEPTFAAPESFNNELGIALSKAKISKLDKYAIFEVGMNMKNESFTNS